MSASLKPSVAGWLWTDAELARAKELRREGFTVATISGTLQAEFGTIRTAMGVQQMFTNLRRRGEAVAPLPPKQVIERKAELALANSTRRECLASGRGHWFDSWGPGNRVCDACKRLGPWW